MLNGSNWIVHGWVGSRQLAEGISIILADVRSLPFGFLIYPANNMTKTRNGT